MLYRDKEEATKQSTHSTAQKPHPASLETVVHKARVKMRPQAWERGRMRRRQSVHSIASSRADKARASRCRRFRPGKPHVKEPPPTP